MVCKIPLREQLHKVSWRALSTQRSNYWLVIIEIWVALAIKKSIEKLMILPKEAM